MSAFCYLLLFSGVVGVVSLSGLFPGFDWVSFFGENWDWMVSVFIAAVAVLVSVFSLSVQRHHNRLAVRPDISLDVEPDGAWGQPSIVTLSLRNVGYGTAKIISINFLVNDKVVEDDLLGELNEIFRCKMVKGSRHGVNVADFGMPRFSRLSGVSIPPGGTFELMKFSCGDVGAVNHVIDQVDTSLSIRGCCLSSYDEEISFGRH